MQSHWMRSDLLAGLFAFLLFLAVNIVADRLFAAARLDLTDQGLFTLSDGTRTVLQDLEEPIRLTLYFSETAASSFPQIYAYGRRVRDLLEEYRAVSDGKVRLKVVDPEPFTEAEDDAVAAGIRGLALGDGTSLYLGLVAEDATDRREVIPYLSPDRERFLEYDLTKMVYTLDAGALPKLALVSALPLQGQPQASPFGGGGGAQPQVIYSQLQELYEVEDLGADFTEIPADTDVLMLIHPPDLSPAQSYAVDQFVLKGGRTIVFVDPNAEAAAFASPFPGAPSEVPAASDLPELLEAWGVDFTSDRVVADAALAQRVNFGGGGFREVKDYLVWLAVGDNQIDRDDPVTGPVSVLNLAIAGALSPRDGATTRFEPLIRSTETSTLLPVADTQGQPDPDQLMRGFVADEARYTLAARVTGPARSAFPDGPPDAVDPGADEDDGPEPGEAAEDGSDTGAPADQDHLGEGEIAVILLADADIVDDRFWVQTQQIFGQRILQPIADNGVLVINMVDALAGSDALLSLRGRGTAQRPFDRVEALRRDAEARFLAEEERLQAQLQETERRLQELQGGAGEGDLILTPEQEAEIARFQQERLDVRQELRRVQRNLRADIESLGNWLAFVNIGLVPLLVIGFAVYWFGFRRKGAAA